MLTMRLTMRLKRGIQSLCIIAIVILAVGSGISHEANNRVASTQTIPPVLSVSPGIEYLCSVPSAFPASIAAGTSGFLIVTCFGSRLPGLLLLGTNAAIKLTPTFILSVGFDNVTLLGANIPGNPCDFGFTGAYTFGNVTVPAQSYMNHPIIFANPPTNSSEMAAGIYNYCLHYTNAPLAGQSISSFTVTWT